MAGMVMSNGAASSVTVASPCARRASIARRVGSAKALKVLSKVSVVVIIELIGYITTW